jgi:hypothetical protein
MKFFHFHLKEPAVSSTEQQRHRQKSRQVSNPILRMEEENVYETSENFYRTTRRHVPEYRKSHLFFFVLTQVM